jgi:hypothetical protein
MSTKTYILIHSEARNRALEAVRTAPDGFAVKVGEATRTLEQNALLWKLLSCVSEKVEWYGEKLDAESWKHIFSASLKKQKAVPGIDGGSVVLGLSTSKMTKKEFSDLVELIHAFCAERGIEID